MARVTIRQAVEHIARELDGPTPLTDIAQEAARRAGRSYTKYARRTASDVLSRCRQVVRCARGVYAPARVALHGKSFRVPLSPAEVESARISVQRLEPFYQALGDPPVCTADGRVLPISNEPADQQEHSTMPRWLPGPDNLVCLAFGTEAETETELEPDWVVEGEDWFRPELNDVYIDLTALELTGVSGAEGNERTVADLTVRWDQASGMLKVAVSASVRGDVSETVACEDQALAEFLFNKLPDLSAAFLPSLLLEAYASCPQVGRTPGSAVCDVIENAEDLRVMRSDGWNMVRVVIARFYVKFKSDREREMAEFVELVRDHVKSHVQEFRRVIDRERRRLGLIGAQGGGRRPSAKVVWLHRPSHSDLISEWEAALRQQEVSDRMRKRKVGHLETFAEHLETYDPQKPLHFFDVDDVYLEKFFFRTYIFDYPNSYHDATTFAIDLREFYVHQEHLGRIPHARFAEFIYRVRWLIDRRLRAYDALRGIDGYDDTSDLYMMLCQETCDACDDRVRHRNCPYGL